MNKTKLCCLFLTVTIIGISDLGAQLFYQDFQSSSNVPDYIGTGANQFDNVGSSGPGVTVSISSGSLQYVRTSGNSGVFVKLGLGPVPLMKFVFTLEVPNASANTTTAALIRIGQGYPTNFGSPSNSLTHTRLGINLIASSGFQLRDIGTGNNSPTFAGIQTITLVLNHSGSTANYIDPNGNTSSIANDRSDVWIGNAIIFDEMNITSSVNLSDIQMLFNNGAGTIRFDNFLITSESPLPIELSHFQGTAKNNSIELSWTTVSESNAEVFEVERSHDGTGFKLLATIPAAGFSNQTMQYKTTDFFPLPGPNYYRLRQVDFDGSYTYSPVISVYFEKGQKAAVYPTVTGGEVHVVLPGERDYKTAVQLYDQSGRLVKTMRIEADLEDFDFSVADLQAGVYILKILGGRLFETHRILKLR
ncbi:MAG: T9SS type A sorting domain-containing protein [Saprospiraceae bacterium]